MYKWILFSSDWQCYLKIIIGEGEIIKVEGELPLFENDYEKQKELFVDFYQNKYTLIIIILFIDSLYSKRNKLIRTDKENEK